MDLAAAVDNEGRDEGDDDDEGNDDDDDDDNHDDHDDWYDLEIAGGNMVDNTGVEAATFVAVAMAATDAAAEVMPLAETNELVS